jgi:hypothetical protein
MLPNRSPLGRDAVGAEVLPARPASLATEALELPVALAAAAERPAVGWDSERLGPLKERASTARSAPSLHYCAQIPARRDEDRFGEQLF